MDLDQLIPEQLQSQNSIQTKPATATSSYPVIKKRKTEDEISNMLRVEHNLRIKFIHEEQEMKIKEHELKMDILLRKRQKYQ